MRDSGKVNNSNQLPRCLASSTRECQLLPVSSVVSFSVRTWVSRIFPRNWNSRIFSRSQLPRQWCFRGKFLCFPFLDKFCPERQCDFSRVDLREKMWDSGKVNKYYQLPSLRISSSNQLPGISSSLVILPSAEFQRALNNNPRELIYGKRCETREKLIKVCKLPSSRVFSRNQLPRHFQ
jgi:hypothetical protein